MNSSTNLFYLILPFLTWLITGGTKFFINSLKHKKLSFDLIGYGGFPSNHSAILSSMTFFIYLNEGLSPVFGAMIAVSFLFILDATDLRVKVGKMARSINQLSDNKTSHRERIGHSYVEVLGGVILGVLIAYMVWFMLA